MLEVEQDSAAVERGLDSLIKKMTSLRDVVSNGRGYGTTAKGIKEIGAAANSLNENSATNLRAVVNAMQGLQGLSNIKLSSSIASQIRGIGDSARSLQGIDWSGVRAIATNLAPLENINKAAGLTSTLAAMKKLPEVVESLNTNLDDAKIARFAERVNVLRNSLVPLANEMRAIVAGFNALPRNIQKAINATNKFADASKHAHRSSGGLLRRLTSIAAAYVSLRAVWRFGMDAFQASNDYVEAINLANVAMGKGAKGAMEYAQKVEDLIGINMSDWITQMGTFNQMIAGFGIAQKDAAHMSQQLTQLGYDIQSAFNAKDIGQVMDRLQSGLAGQIKGMREYGVELSVAAMREFALERGITKKWTAMSMAEKTALRYAKIMADTGNIQKDLSRTLVTPANSLRILNAQWQVATRYIGQFVSVIATRVIPVVQTAVSVIATLAKTLASAWGYALPEIPTTGIVGGLGDVEDAIDNVGGAAGGAGKKLKGLLASWDEINVIQSESGGGSGGSSAIKDAFDFTGLTDYSYDFLEGIKSKTQNVTKAVQNLLPYLKMAAIAFGTWKIAKGVSDFVVGTNGLFELLKGAGLALKIPVAITGIVSGFMLVQDATTQFLEGNKDLVATLVQGALGFGVTAITTGLVTGSAALGFTIAGGVALAAVVTAFYLQKEKEYSDLAAEAFARSGEGGVSPSDMIAAVEAEFSARAGSAKLVIDAYADVGNYNEALKQATAEIAALNNVIFGDEALTAEQAESFKTSWQTVTDTLDSITNASYNTVFKGLVEAAQSANAELALQAEQAQKNLIMIQTGYTERQAERKAEMNELVDKIINGEATKEDMKAYKDLANYFNTLEEGETKLAFEEALANAANVNYESMDDVKSYVSELQGAYEKYVGVNNDALNAFNDGIANIRLQAKAELEYGAITQDEYNAINAQLDEMVAIYTQTIEEKNRELKAQASQMLAGVLDQALNNPEIANMDYGTFEKYLQESIYPIFNMLSDSGVMDEAKLKSYNEFISELARSVHVVDDALAANPYGMTYSQSVDARVEESRRKAELALDVYEMIKEFYAEPITPEFDTGELDETANQIKDLGKYQPLAKDFLSDFEQAGLLTDGVTVEVKANTSEIPTAMSELTTAVDDASKQIQDSLTYNFTVNVKLTPSGGIIGNHPFIPRYAEGGMPQTGSLFIANESGPELVGRFGSGTGVANSDQIVAGITAGVSQANSSQNALLREQNALLRQLLDKEFTASVTPSVGFGQAAQRSLDMFNRVSGVNR